MAIYLYTDNKRVTRTFCVLSIVTIFTHCAALGLAVARDGSSGGVLRLAVIDENGVERMLFTGSEIPTFYTE